MNKYQVAKFEDDDKKKNPHFDTIEGYWVDLRPRLAAFDGQGSVQILSKLRESEDSLDKRIWNALYWRTDSWFKSYLGRRELSDDERAVGFESHEVGGPRWSAWLHDTYSDRPSPVNWQTEDLKFILQSLK
jgi:hypothetical protein